jgi:hypothetical protein
MFRLCLTAALLVGSANLALAQQRPLSTEDPEPVGAGRVLIEGGVDYEHAISYPVSGLHGNLWRMPTLGLSVGISSIAEFQIDGGAYNTLAYDTFNPNAPLAGLVTAVDGRTQDVQDIVIGTKIRLTPEGAGHPSIAVRFATKLPNASNESGLGLDTIDFYTSLLVAKTVESIRLVGNIGLGILSDPVDGNLQNDVLTYGASVARALTDSAEMVGELNGRISTRSGDPLPGSESRGHLLLGGRYTRGPIRFDGGVLIGLTSVDAPLGLTGGFTYVFHAFDIP